MKLATSAATALLAASLAAAQNTTTCASGVHMIVARGSDEEQGPGRMGRIADGVEEAIPGSDIESLVWPATFDNYANSVNEGVDALGSTIKRYTDRCPDAKVVLMGYSQGGQVTMNTLCGGPETAILPFEENPAFDGAVVNKSVIAVVVFGDPSFVDDAPWTAGNHSNVDGIFAPRNLTECLPYADKIRSWCDEGDRYCARGNVSTVHGGYFDKYFDDAVDFVVGRFNETEEGGASPTSSGAPSGTDGASPTGSEAVGGDGGSGAGMIAVSWGVMAVAGVVGLMSL